MFDFNQIPKETTSQIIQVPVYWKPYLDHSMNKAGIHGWNWILFDNASESQKTLFQENSNQLDVILDHIPSNI